MKNSILFSFIILASIASVISCSKINNTIPTGNEILVLPSTTALYNQQNKTVDNNKATLGRVLFYDKHLSLNNSVSCGSCHQQLNGFADNKIGSKGINNITTSRNTLAIQNLTILDSFSLIFNNFGTQHLFWDNRETNLKNLMLRPVGNHIEMGITDYDALVQKLNTLPYYKSLVQAAYHKEELNTSIIADALSNFCSSIRTVNSRFDKFNLGNTEAINTKEKLGLQLFMSAQYNCVSCHTSMFAANNINNGGSVYGGGGSDSTESFAANIGLNTNNSDGGIGNVTNKNNQKGMFKIPDLHNVAVTAPYMHDGSKATLNDVLDHYSSNINTNLNLDARLKNTDGTPKRLNINTKDKEAIIAFLNSLTDEQSLTNPIYSNPFIIK